jgi:hypothetical protein
MEVFMSDTPATHCHYDMYCFDETITTPDVELIEECAPYLRWTRATRAEADAFAPPAFVPGAANDRLATPTNAPEQLDPIRELVARAPICFRIETEGEDMGALEAALSVVADLVESQGEDAVCVVVDRTSSIGYSAEHILAQADAFSENGGVVVRETISLEERDQGATTRISTHGMEKYGALDFVIEDFPSEHVELGRRLLYDNLCAHSALRATIVGGQNFQYSRSDDAAKLYFTPSAAGPLVVSDCHPTEKVAVPGLEKFISVCLPSYLEFRARE